MTRLIFSILIALSPATAQQQGSLPFGTVTVPEGVSIVVVDDRGKQVTTTAAETAIQLPAGRYRMISWTLERKDQDGNVWKLTGSAFGKKGVFKLIAGREVELPVGEPAFSTLAMGKNGSTYRLNHCLTGRLSESVEIRKNENRPAAPELRITNTDGSYQETLSFGYS